MRTLALAFLLERFYTAAESVLVRVLKTVDGGVPSSGSWHLEVLKEAQLEIPGLRPPVLCAEVGRDLRELLKFRHLARQGYDIEPDLSKIEQQARLTQALMPGLRSSLAEFCRYLRDGS